MKQPRIMGGRRLALGWFVLCAALFGVLGLFRAELRAANYQPILFTGYNEDMIIEAGAVSNAVPITNYATATMWTGTANTSYTFYELGYNPNGPGTGLPTAGTSISVMIGTTNHTYTMASSYATNNVILLQTNTLPAANITLANPAIYRRLSFLCACANGPVSNKFILQYVDQNNTVANNIRFSDWQTNTTATNIAYDVGGAVDVGNKAFTNVFLGVFKLYVVDIPVANTASPLTNVQASWISGQLASHSVIFAVSGQTNLGGDLWPIALTADSYNRDIVIESNAPSPLPPQQPSPPPSGWATWAMDGASHDFFEIGFTNNLSLGIPHPGVDWVNAAASDHIYRMATNYAANTGNTNNAVAIDGQEVTGHIHDSTTLTLNTPAAYSSLSFVHCTGDAGTGSVIQWIATHADTTSDVGTFTSLDWFNNTPVAWTAGSRANIFGLNMDGPSTNPRLYYADAAVANSNSPIVSIQLNWVSGGGRTAVYAISGLPTAVTSTPPPPFYIRAARSLSSSQFMITWDSLAGTNYLVLSRTNSLTTIGGWRTNGSVTATSTSTSFTNAVPAGGYPSYYRVLIPLGP